MSDLITDFAIFHAEVWFTILLRHCAREFRAMLVSLTSQLKACR